MGSGEGDSRNDQAGLAAAPPLGPALDPGDAIRLVLALVVLAVSWLLARSGVPDWERRLFRFINSGSDRWDPLLWPIMQLGNVVVAGAVG